jgi:hypothetical protein
LLTGVDVSAWWRAFESGLDEWVSSSVGMLIDELLGDVDDDEGESQTGGGTGGGGGSSRHVGGPSTPRHTLVEGSDWVLAEYARVPGVVHMSASTNPAGGGCGAGGEDDEEEEEWLVVAYEAFDNPIHADPTATPPSPSAADEQQPQQPQQQQQSTEEMSSHVELLVWFQPNNPTPAAAAPVFDGAEQISEAAAAAGASDATPAAPSEPETPPATLWLAAAAVRASV